MNEANDQQSKDLHREIEMLRQGIDQLYRSGRELDEVDDVIRLLNALGLAATRLAAMLKAQDQLGAEAESSVLAAIQRAIARTVEEQGLS